MAALTLHYHPLSSYCHKVLIALEELAIPVEKCLLNLGDPAQRAAFRALWPTGKMPLLVDQGRPVAETSIIIEYLQTHHAGDGRRLIPHAAAQALEVRLWDRLFDQYVMTPMNAFTSDLLRAEAERDALNVAPARDMLLASYAMIERQLEDGRSWVADDHFSMADCAAAPALFYGRAYVPPPAEHTRLAAYFERLQARPSVARTVDAARPWFTHFPGREGLERRFWNPDAAA